MRLIELAKGIGLTPIRAGSTYSSPCPECGGKDRFIIWPNDKYWCRRCEKNGDAIQFCRDFMGLTYFEACKKLNLEIRSCSLSEPLQFNEFKVAKEPSLLWQERALAFTNWAHHNLINNPTQLSMLHERMINMETIIKYRLGFCMNHKKGQSKDFFINRSSWGLSEELKENGKSKKLWLPSGFVIPTFDLCGKVLKLKIRRLDWHENDKLPKYVEIAGSMQKPSFFGQSHKPSAILVESEFDAIIIQQEAGDLCRSIALGGAAKKADAATHQLLKNIPQILYALDFDEAGKKQYRFWRQSYRNLRAWPVPITKSPGDALKNGICLRQWVSDGISEYKSLLIKEFVNEKQMQI